MCTAWCKLTHCKHCAFTQRLCHCFNCLHHYCKSIYRYLLLFQCKQILFVARLSNRTNTLIAQLRIDDQKEIQLSLTTCHNLHIQLYKSKNIFVFQQINLFFINTHLALLGSGALICKRHFISVARDRESYFDWSFSYENCFLLM